MAVVAVAVAVAAVAVVVAAEAVAAEAALPFPLDNAGAVSADNETTGARPDNAQSTCQKQS